MGHQPAQGMQCPMKKMDVMDGLPVKDLSLGTKNRRVFLKLLMSQSKDWWILHSIPVVVLLCFFILWWFSYPGMVEKKI